MTQRQTVFVGLSGGVDSSVSALRLKRAGFNVVGVFIRVWNPDFLVCDQEAERLDAMRVAAFLDIPFLTCDAVERYRKDVGEYFIREYLAGRTPNPDVMCNKHVKFGVFLDFALEHGAQHIATGHYAQTKVMKEDRVLLRGADPEKDQSYFLWTLTAEQLRHTLFPVGNSMKSDIRREAAGAKLPTATKRDSQGICFLGHVDIQSFLSHFTALEKGPVLDTSGVIIGEHEGALIYTLGQRHGFRIRSANDCEQKHFVVARDLSRNTITVDTKPPQISAGDTLDLEEVHWIGESSISRELEIQYRYRQAPLPAYYTELNGRSSITLHENTDRPAIGQSCVLYDRDQCLGGGIIAT